MILGSHHTAPEPKLEYALVFLFLKEYIMCHMYVTYVWNIILVSSYDRPQTRMTEILYYFHLSQSSKSSPQ